jgi:hypothetical protein
LPEHEGYDHDQAHRHGGKPRTAVTREVHDDAENEYGHHDARTPPRFRRAHPAPVFRVHSTIPRARVLEVLLRTTINVREGWIRPRALRNGVFAYAMKIIAPPAKIDIVIPERQSGG